MADIKISALNPASPLTGREMIPAVQDGFPVKVYVSNVSIYGDNVIEKYTNEINIDKLYPLATGYYTLSTAIAAVAAQLRSVNAKITFKSAVNTVDTWVFNSTVDGWGNVSFWKLLGDDKVTKKIGSNLFNPTDFQTGYYINSLGEVTSNPAYGITGYIPFKQSDVNLISNFFASSDSGSYNILYDINKNKITTFKGSLATWQANVAYVIFSGPTVDLTTIMVNVGTTLLSLRPYTVLSKMVSEDSLLDECVSTDKLKDGAVTPQKASFFKLGKNLFNPNDSDVALGYYVYYGSGELSANSIYNATGYIPVVGGQNYTTSYKHQIAWYDSNKVYISGSNSSDENTTQLAPTNAAYCRCTVAETLWSVFQFELGTSQTLYEAYGLKVDSNYIPSDSFFPSLSLTRKLHILANNENSIYYKSLIERWNPYKYIIQTAGTGWNYFERYSRANGATAGDINISTYDGITLALKQSKTITVVVGNPATNNGSKTIQIIGDSFSYNGYWFDKTNQLCPALTFVGIRKSYNTLLKAEGRGGWTLALYMNSKHATNDSFSPFLHPADPYKYYGNTAFWIAVKTGSGDYGIAGFTDIANTIGFNSTTGLKAAPAANDVMYNDANARYEVYNGTAWVAIDEATLSFTINYAKYLTTWGITMPDIVGILLGCNDFRDTILTDDSFAAWKTQMDTLINSIKSAATALSKSVKIAICLPMTETASANNSAGINPIFQRANMFDARNRIIAAFDNDTYSNASVDVVDTGTAVDGDFGFDMSTIKPFAGYSGAQTEMYANNVPHPNNDGYAQLGTRLAGYIQSIR